MNAPRHPELLKLHNEKLLLDATPLSEAADRGIAETKEALKRPLIEHLGEKVWLWGDGTPDPPPTLAEHVRFSFSHIKQCWLEPTHPLYWPKKTGLADLGVFSRPVNGLDILDDLAEACAAAYRGFACATSVGHLAVDGIRRPHRSVEVNNWLFTSVKLSWQIE